MLHYTKKLMIPSPLTIRPRRFWPSSKFTLVALLICAANALASDGANSEANPPMVHRMMLLTIQFGTIIFAAKFFNMLFEKLKMPGVLGELCAGMVIGPFALGTIALPGFSGGVFPPVNGMAVSPELTGIATIASIVLLFDVGLETDLKLLIRYSLAGSLVGIGGVIASFALGMASMYWFSESMLGEQVGFFHYKCLYMGVVSTATSVGITARILSEKRKLDSPEGVTILSAAVIDDVIGIIMLAVVGGIAKSQQSSGGVVDWGHIGGIGAKAVGVWLVATVIGIAASRKISVLLKFFGERTSIAVMALGMALILAGLFEEAGLAMIIGAYVMGLSLSQADISHVVREKIHSIYTLLVPVFFCVTGMMIDLSAMTDSKVLAFGGVYTVLALVAKVFGCGLPAMLANFNFRGAMRVGFGMAPRGEVGLIVASIGLSSGILDERLFAAVIIMVVINTVLAPPVLVGLFKNPARGTRKESPHDADETVLEFDFPSIPMIEFFVTRLTHIFEHEGFFCHLLNRKRRLWQLRKDADVIEFTAIGTDLKFHCPNHCVRFIRAAMLEATADVEHAVKNLRKPFDTSELQSGMQASTQRDSEQTRQLRQYLRANYIKPHLAATTKDEVLVELVDLLLATGQVPTTSRDAVLTAVREREESMTTGMQYGVAIPHGRTDAVNSLVCVIGIKPDGIDFAALDGQPSTIFVLTLSPEHKPAPHVQFMSTISTVLDETGREKILTASTATQILNVFLGT